MWDLTHTLSEDMLLYPGIPQPKLYDFATPAREGYGMSEFAFWNHLGTHIDAPTHFYGEGQSLDRFAIEQFVKRVVTVDCQQLPAINSQHLSECLAHYRPGDAVLLLTGQYQYWGTPRYFEPFPVLTADGAEWLVNRRVEMILVDAPSVDPVTTETYAIHRVLLQAPLLIVENLAYQPGLPTEFEIIALPLKVKDSNGSPARVIARPL